MKTHDPIGAAKLVGGLDAQTLVAMLARWYADQARRDGFTLTHEDAKQAAIAAVFGFRPRNP